MRVLAYSGNIAVIDEIKEKLAGKDVTTTRQKDKFLEFAYSKDYDIVCVDIWDADKEARELLGAVEDIKILILSHEPKFSEGREFLRLGAKGYANARMLEVHFKDALEAIERGEVWLYPEFIQNMIQMMTKEILPSNSSNLLENLTNKEKEIAQLVYKGLNNQEIGEILQITVRTVKAHVGTIFEKTGAKDRINLILLMQKME